MSEMAKRDWLFEVPKKEAQAEHFVPTLDHTLQLRLSELTKRNIGLKIYSEVLGSEMWLCGNEDMAAQLREDDPGAIIYTADEMRKLMRLNPKPDELRAIHNSKTVFPGSVVVDNSLKGPDGI